MTKKIELTKEEKISNIERYYHRRKISFLISYFTSILGGFVAGVIIAIATGQKVEAIYQKFVGASVLGVTFFSLTLLYGLILWYFMIYSPEHKDLEEISGKIKKKAKWSFWEIVWVIASIVILGITLSLGNIDFAFKFLVTMTLLIWLMRLSKEEISKSDVDRVEKKLELCKLRLSNFQNMSTTLMSVGAGFIASGIAINAANYNLTWMGLLMIIIGIMVEKYQVEPRYYLLERHYKQFEKAKLTSLN